MRALVATDGSPCAAVAVDLAATLRWPSGSEINVVQAIEPGLALNAGPFPGIGPAETERLQTALDQAAADVAAEAAGRLRRPGLTVRAGVAHGRPARAIVDAARAMAADLIVVGSRGHGTIASMVLGSVSAEVVDHAPCPVVVARNNSVERIVLGWDGSAAGRRAADLLLRWPIFGGAAIHVVSVADVPTPWWTGFPQPGSAELMTIYADAAQASREQHDGLVREMTRQLRDGGLSAEGERRDGDPATEIIAAARAVDAQLVVLGTHGRTGLARLALGSVARNVLHHAACSVLIAHDVGRQVAEPDGG